MCFDILEDFLREIIKNKGKIVLKCISTKCGKCSPANLDFPWQITKRVNANLQGTLGCSKIEGRAPPRTSTGPGGSPSFNFATT